MTGSDRRVTFCKKFKEPYAEAKPDWLIFTEFAEYLGGRDLFPYANNEDIFSEFRRATKERLCDISDFTYSGLPERWGGKWLYKDRCFYTASRKARFNAAVFRQPEEAVDAEYRFILITGRTRKQWHTMTRTGKSHGLTKGEKPYILMNRSDAQELGLSDGDTANLSSKNGAINIKVRIGEIKKRHLFTPFGFNNIDSHPINTLVNINLDPLSGQPELKYTAVCVAQNRRPIT